MTVPGEIGFPDGAAVLDLDVAWIHGSEAAKYNTDPDIQVHACDEHTYILRQNMAVSYEAPFRQATRQFFAKPGAIADSQKALIRTGERIYMDTWLANQADGNLTPVRAGRRMRYIDEALRPLGDRLDEPIRKRLRCALALALGTHAVIAMKDSAGLDDDEEIVATIEWAAGALLRTALHDFEQSP